MTDYRAKYETAPDDYTKKTIGLSRIVRANNLPDAYTLSKIFAKDHALTLLRVDES